jgi:Ser/Thr protein kinase RdoA (MazF antagonist)
MTTVAGPGPRPLPRRVPSPGKLARTLRAHRSAPAFAEPTVRAVVARYGLELAGSSRALPEGARSDNLMVPTASGTVVVKRYPARAAVPAIQHEHSISRRLAAGGYPVAPLRTGLDGSTWCTVEDRHFAVSGLVEGVSLSGCYLSPTGDAPLYRTAGALLAWFHTELIDFDPEGHHHLGLQMRSPHAGGMVEAPLAALERLERDVVASGLTNRTERWLAARTELIGAHLREVAARLAQCELTIGVIHGDYGLHNLTFTREGQPTVHDLELARVEPLLVDVIVVLSRSSRRCGRAFLEGYRSIRSIPSADWDALPDLWQHYRLSGAVRSWRNFRDQGGLRRLATARHRVEESARIAAQGVGAWQ